MPTEAELSAIDQRIHQTQLREITRYLEKVKTGIETQNAHMITDYLVLGIKYAAHAAISAARAKGISASDPAYASLAIAMDDVTLENVAQAIEVWGASDAR